MKVTYTSEQKRVAIQTYRRVKSYAKTIQILGYPSYHVLIDWVKGVSHGRPNKVGHVSSHHYSWQTKRQAVDMMLAGVEKDDIATQLSIHCSQQIYKWVRIWRTQGDGGLMSKSEKGETARRPTKNNCLPRFPKTEMSSRN